MAMHWLNIQSTGVRFHETHIRTLFPGARRLGHDPYVDSLYTRQNHDAGIDAGVEQSRSFAAA
jgi:hypothetical protein